MEEPATRLGRYRLLHRIGGGGMGEVHRARAYGAAGVTKEICIKRIREKRLAAPGALDAFVREARISARLAHPNIVPVFDFGRSEDEYYLAMEWIDGVDLRALLDGSEPLEDYVIAYIVAEIARALAYAHETAPDAPIVHRDVKPANVLISRNGDVHLGDFGVATFDGQTGGVAGTPGYMAPEVEKGLADVRSDLYSLGKVLGAMGGLEREPLAHIATQLTSQPDDRPSAVELAEQLETYVAQIRGRGARSARSLLADHVRELADTLEATSGEGAAIEQTHSLLHAPEATASTAAPIEARAGAQPRRLGWVASALGLALVAMAGWFAVARGELPASSKRVVTVKTASTPDTATAAFDEPHADPVPPAETSTPIDPVIVATVTARRPRVARTVRTLGATSMAAVASASEAPEPASVAAEVEAALPAVGRVSINAIPWARVSIDGVDRGSTPLLGLEFEPGTSHRLVLVNDVLDARAERTIVLEAGETRRVIVDLRETTQGQVSASAQTTPPP